MKKRKRIWGMLAGSVVLLLAMLGTYILQKPEQNIENAEVCAAEAEIIGTRSVEKTKPRAEEQIKEIGLSYIERYGLEHVDKPEERDDEQVLQRIAELAEQYELVKQINEQPERYSMEMLKNLANNPEMAAYVIGSVDADGSVYGGFTEEELAEKYPLLLQFDPRWGYFEYGGKEMGLSGCGPTCLAMVILALTDYEDVTPDKIAQYSTDKKYYVEGVGTAWKLMDDVPPLYGLAVEHTAIKEKSMKAELDKGNILICSVRKGVFTSEGHFVVIYGYDETGFLVNDPKCVARSRKTWQFSEFGNQLKRIWSIGAENKKNG